MSSDSGDAEEKSNKKLKRNLKRKRNDESDTENNEEKAADTDGAGSGSDDDGSDEDDKKSSIGKFRINPLNVIKNKEVRAKLFKKQQQQKKKERRQARRQRRLAGEPRNTGHTIESLRETDHTAITHLPDSDTEEIQKELELDEFSEYYSKAYVPKVFITYADNPLTKARKFGVELARIIPNSIAKIRNRASVKTIVTSAIRENFTDVLIINEDHRQPNGLVMIHLPNGPTAHFRLSNVKITKEIKRSHEEFTKHRPEVILTNFTTRLGLTIGRMFGALFHHDPEFVGRRAVTFHNQRDYIFFRHHRYEFRKDGKRANLRELGPRFTLKLLSLQEGTFDSKYGDYNWMITNKRHAMEGRRRFFL